MKGGDTDYVTCPGQGYAIPAAMCAARQQWGFPGCLKCRNRIKEKERKRDATPDPASQPTLFDLS